MLDKTPQVFISYSWSSLKYQDEVISLATRMRHDGVDVKLDIWDLKEGQDKYTYMEQCVTNPSIDRVLILSDRMYAEKANHRKGGVGDETTIISAEVYNDADQQKFIPVVMERDEAGKEYLPAYLKSRLYIDLSGANFEDEYVKLLRNIYDEPFYRKPEIGKCPNWLTEEIPDSLFFLKETSKKLSATDLDRIKAATVHEFIDTYIEAIKHLYVSNIDKDTYLENFISLKEYRDVFLNQLKEFSNMEHFGSVMADEFERLYNALYNIDTFSPGATSYNNNDFDLFRVHVWELFICTVTFMLHFGLYSDIHELLVHTYFLRISCYGSEQRPAYYDRFRFHSKMLEEQIKPTMEGDLSAKHTLMGYYVCTEREYRPIYSGIAMANADLFLYQVFNGLNLENSIQSMPWFPTLYFYADENNSMWKRLISKEYCEKIKLIFGVETIKDLKDRINNCKPDRDFHYSKDLFGFAKAILSWINLDDVATLP